MSMAISRDVTASGLRTGNYTGSNVAAHYYLRPFWNRCVLIETRAREENKKSRRFRGLRASSRPFRPHGIARICFSYFVSTWRVFRPKWMQNPARDEVVLLLYLPAVRAELVET
jgi:hypothetical protein